MKRIDSRITALEQVVKARPEEQERTWADFITQVRAAPSAPGKPKKMTWDEVVQQMRERRDSRVTEEANREDRAGCESRIGVKNVHRIGL